MHIPNEFPEMRKIKLVEITVIEKNEFEGIHCLYSPTCGDEDIT